MHSLSGIQEWPQESGATGETEDIGVLFGLSEEEPDVPDWGNEEASREWPTPQEAAELSATRGKRTLTSSGKHVQAAGSALAGMRPTPKWNAPLGLRSQSPRVLDRVQLSRRTSAVKRNHRGVHV